MNTEPYATGDNWELYAGECAAVMRECIADESIDLVVTSPPYDGLREYKGFEFDFYKVANELSRVIKPGGVIVWVVNDATVKGSETGTSFRQALYFMDVLGLRLHDTMIYQTDKPPMNDNRYQACFEYMFVFSKGNPKAFNPIMVKTIHGGKRNTSRAYFQKDGSLKSMNNPGKYKTQKVKTSIWGFSSGNEKTGHPATFPEALARDHIISWSNPGDLILDPFMGSGTTAKMAKLNGRNYIGFEISQEYCDIAAERLSKYDGL